MKKIIITSAYCNPLHPGHVECFELAKQLGDELIVIINNDKQAAIKRGVKSFQDEVFRSQIVKNLKSVDEVFLAIDETPSVVESIKKVFQNIKNKYPDSKVIFAKGGDRFAAEIPEAVVCQELGIEIVDGLGAKTHSSSDYVKSVLKLAGQDEKEKIEIEEINNSIKENYLEIGIRPWGKYFVMEDKEKHKVKRIFVNPKSRLSLQSHTKRQEHWVVVSGVATVQIDENIFDLYPGQSCNIPLQAKHRLSNNSESESVEVVEVQYGTYTGEDDIVRYEDDYERR